MQALSGFRVQEELYSSAGKSVLKVVRDVDGLRGVLKFFQTDAGGHAEIERIKNEFNCLKSVDSVHVITVRDLVFFDEGVGILMDDFQGESLDHVLARRGRLDLPLFLSVATQLCSGLRDIHQRKVVHRDLKPSNALLNGETGELKIIDFGISHAFSNSQAGDLMGSLPYMSPEQTGKMNRTVDLRSDLYSLGVVFYELLTGRCPFVSDDPLELVHSHIARVPTPPSEINPSIPSFVCDLVMRLLEKEAESRYHSASGVLADLAICQSYIAKAMEIPADLQVGDHDQHQLFRIPERLYGREDELQRLLETFSRAERGSFEPILVAGYSGIGKSALIHEVQKPLVAARGYFASGKSDQFNKAKPYSAIQQALGELVRIVLRQSEEEIEAVRKELLAALRGEGQCLVEVVPLLETLLGPQPDLPDGGPVSRQNRFNRNCDAFLRVFADADHPLVLFLDDMQWADAASLGLVRSWLGKRIPYAMLILAYRDNEVGPTHPLALMLSEGLRDQLESRHIRLGPLGTVHAEQLIADTLDRSPKEVRGLAAVHMEKTGGNPFFLIQMFQGLYQDGLVAFERDGWSWDLEEIAARNLTDNVVDLMTRKLHRYSDETRSALNMCGILGTEFALRTLSIVLRASDEVAYRAVLPAIEDGLLKEAGGRLRFAHDKVHEAAYGLAVDEDRKVRHRLVGRHLLDTLDPASVEEQLFKIVADLNRSSDLIQDASERVELARLNIRAGKKALASSAFVPSRELFESAMALLDDDAWQRDLDLAFQVFQGHASACYASAQYEACERSLMACLDNVRDPVKTAPIVQLLLDVLFSQNRHEEGAALGLQRLRALDVDIRPNPSKVHVMGAYAAFRSVQGLRPTPTLVNLPPATDARAIAAMGILNALIPSTYTLNADLMAVVALRMAQLSLSYGNTLYSPYGYAVCMCLEAAVFKAFESADQYMDLAFAVHEKYPDAWQRGRIEMIRACFNLHQIHSLDDWERHANTAVTYNLDAGSMNFADYVVAFTRAQSLFFHDSLDEAYRSNLKALELHRESGDHEVIENQEFILHMINRWRGPVERSASEIDAAVDGFDLESYGRRMAEPGNNVARGYWVLVRQLDLYLRGEFEESLRVGLGFALKALDLFGIMADYMHRYMFMLAYLAADHRKLSAAERAGAATYYQVNRGMYALYDKRTAIYRSHVALARAEEHRMHGRALQALAAYENAIREARDTNRLNEALACRRLAQFHLDAGRELEAGLVARQAWFAFRAWGARAEMRRLEQDFPEIRLVAQEAPAARALSIRPAGPTASATFTQQLDLESLARGAQAISSQVRLDALIEALLRQLCQSSAAQRAVLLLDEEGVLHIEGEISVSGRKEELSVLGHRPFPSKRGTERLVAESVVQYVARVKRTEVSGNAVHEGEFAQDQYIQEREIKSLFCMPIVNQGKLLGVLYLENALVAEAFTAQHQEAIEVLASQAAISIENARLYRNLEQKVEERTVELRRKTNDLNGMLQNLEQGVFTVLEGGKVHHEYSRHLETILGTRSIAGRNFQELLFADSTLQTDSISQMSAAVSFSVGSQVLWYESNRHLLVREMERRRPDGSLRMLELSWSPILTEDEVVEKLLVSVKDVTELRQLERQAKEQRRDLEMIGEILSLPRPTYLSFLSGAYGMVERCEELLQAERLDADGLAALFRNVHTIKGNARTYGFSALAQVAHEVEETYDGCRVAPVESWDAGKMRAELKAVRRTLERYRRVYEVNLEAFAATDDRTTTAIDSALLERIREVASKTDSQELSELLNAIHSTSLEEIVQRVAGGVRTAAEGLGKPRPWLRVGSEGVMFPPETASLLQDVFMHLARNAIDHGLELPEERKARGKDEVGQIEFHARICEEGCEILVRDDGRGLSLDSLRGQAAERDLVVKSETELAELVFVPGLSTAEAVNDISGRGVGMDAIRRFVSDKGGSVQLLLSSEGVSDYRPFTTRIVLPRSEVVLMDSATRSPRVEPAERSSNVAGARH